MTFCETSNRIYKMTSCFLFQVSALDQEVIEVDPDTRDMLKMLVSHPIVYSLQYNLAVYFIKKNV